MGGRGPKGRRGLDGIDGVPVSLVFKHFIKNQYSRLHIFRNCIQGRGGTKGEAGDNGLGSLPGEVSAHTFQNLIHT